MTVEQKTFAPTGTLILVSFLFGVFSIAPSIDGAAFMETAKDDFTQTRFAILSQLMLVVVYVVTAVLFFLMMRKKSPELAYGYLVFKILPKSSTRSPFCSSSPSPP